MIARDVMTRNVVSVTPDTPVRKIASLLVKHGIGAVPVIDSTGAPIGIVSDGDLIRPDRAAREAWRQSWLEILAEGEPLAPELLAWLGSQNRSARAVMSAPLITVSEETNLREIAEILTTRRIRSVPVVTDGRIVGILSRGDLLRALSVGLNSSTGVGERAMTTIAISDGRPKEPRELRELAAWYRAFAEGAGNPVIWEARLRTAAELEQEADRLEESFVRQTEASPKIPRIHGKIPAKISRTRENRSNHGQKSQRIR